MLKSDLANLAIYDWLSVGIRIRIRIQVGEGFPPKPLIETLGAAAPNDRETHEMTTARPPKSGAPGGRCRTPNVQLFAGAGPIYYYYTIYMELI